MHKILFATSEAHPLIKTGGLADVASSLPRALLKRGHDIKILLPAYASVMEKAKEAGVKKVAELNISGQTIFLQQTRLPGSRVAVILVDIPQFSEREGNPYCGPDGSDWSDNHWRFFVFAKAAEAIALNQANLEWQPDIVHCNDWQTGLIPALLAQYEQKPASVFTIHNMAYRGLFSYQVFSELGLPSDYWHHEKLEFYGQMSFIKGGLAFADAITTVSQSYANEIQTPEFGCGLDGVLRARADDLSGVLNGIDMDEWNPGSDKLIAHNYNRRTLSQKHKNKTSLQAQLGLPVDKTVPMIGFIGRLVEQKGIDLILNQMNQLLAQDCQLVILGSGFASYEQALKNIAQQHPHKVSVTLGYNEDFAHQIEASADIFLMPSMFEPCGLNQMYSLRYGTLPIVNAVGGLRDTVIEKPLDDIGSDGNGFVFHLATPEELHLAIKRALACYQQPEIWKKLQQNAMSQDFSWEKSAERYEEIYSAIVNAD
ncbi:glycogen synthase [Cellvibrio zantedeschiae]|uniref:Glycogen synthase n=1 Tax=Cellvibrio zantedeschiae TaxID=1237077 RepID=A0ABQ3B1N8_9GAMM|nr:glycogen synthase GlgA [Cellvibrio zantedeschiae]GGY70730.1 glycogen synthase [Cellvibrio zantedeschiae]